MSDEEIEQTVHPPTRKLLNPHETQEAMKRLKALWKQNVPMMESCERVGRVMGWPATTIWALQKRLQPTTDLATDILKAGSANLAKKIVRKATVDQAIEVLSRTNIGVLSPAKEQGNQGQQFVIGVNVDSLGAVSVGVKIGGVSEESRMPAVSVDDMGGESVTGYPESTPEPEILDVPPAKPALPPATQVIARSVTTRQALIDAGIRMKEKAERREKRLAVMARREAKKSRSKS